MSDIEPTATPKENSFAFHTQWGQCEAERRISMSMQAKLEQTYMCF